MTSWTLWLTLLCAGLLTLMIRLSFILFFGKRTIPPLLLRAFRFVPVTVLSALILPDMLLSKGTIAIGLSNFRLLAGILALLVAWRTKNVLLTLLAGMGSLLLLQLLIK
ncbi:MAG TPA: branched-chain amino acid ABC transporter permease [Ktedonobacter sp.]|nr:branched-chain amino acid ABC transporter permease [Ktedonobacter sp.]